mgnify:CR=1 FL=1
MNLQIARVHAWRMATSTNVLMIPSALSRQLVRLRVLGLIKTWPIPVVDCIWEIKITKYKVHFEARCPDTSSVMSPIITVEADSQYMAQELAEAKFKSQYPHARNYNLSAKKIEQI